MSWLPLLLAAWIVLDAVIVVAVVRRSRSARIARAQFAPLGSGTPVAARSRRRLLL